MYLSQTKILLNITYVKTKNKQKPTGLLSRQVDAVLQISKTSSLPTVSKMRVTKRMKKKLDYHFALKKSVNR